MANKLKNATNPKGVLRRGDHCTREFHAEIIVVEPYPGDKCDLQLVLGSDTEKARNYGDTERSLPERVYLTNEGALKLIHEMLSKVKIDFEKAKELIDLIASRTDIADDQAFALITNVCTTIADAGKRPSGLSAASTDSAGQGTAHLQAGPASGQIVGMAEKKCPFCNLAAVPIYLENDVAIAIPDAFPIAQGHTLVVPRRHVASLFDLSDEEQAAVWKLVAQVRAKLWHDLNPDAFNIGVNDGQAAGQTVLHAHVHVIPRRKGDSPDPRGGVRWVKPEKAKYW